MAFSWKENTLLSSISHLCCWDFLENSEGCSSNDRIWFQVRYISCTRPGWEKGMNTRTVTKTWAQWKMAVVPMELVCDRIIIFCIVSGMRLHFGFVLNTHSVDLTGMILSFLNSGYTESRPLLFLVPPPSEEVKGTQLSWLTPTRALCLAYNAWGRRERKQGTFGVLVFLFWRNSFAWWNPAVLEMAAFPWEIVNDFLVFFGLHVEFLIYLLNCLYLNLHVFFHSSSSLPIPLGDSEQGDG